MSAYFRVCCVLGVSSMEAEGINLLEAVKREAAATGSLFRDTIPGRDALWEFMDVNDWFGMVHSGAGRDARVPSLGPMKSALTLWLRAYGRSRSEKIDLMLEAFTPVFPQTCGMFQDFIQETDSKDEDSTWKLLDFILATLDKEILAYDEAGIRSFIMRANQELTLSGMRQLVDFLSRMGKENWNYQFQSRQIVKPENGAYSLEQFSVMAYTVFNAESWQEHNLVAKAVEKRKYAELWLFTALHFVCAVRKTDLIRLPIPVLPYSPQETREAILQGRFSRSEARAVSEELLFRLEMKSLKPNKTKRSGNVANLKLFIPESVLEPLGIILSLSLSWRERGDPFVSTSAELPDIRAFFGTEFAAVLGEKRFLSRRANKSYLQGIELAADDSSGAKPKGYILAALARSHKGSIGKLAEITDVYLRDANFSGYKPAFILREMFERGIFGFIPALLLENYAGQEYLKLDVASQTQLIKEIGLDALQLENVTSCVMKSFQQAGKIVRGLLREQGQNPRRSEQILQNIASGAAPSKQSELLCLRTASGCPCCMPERTGCLGCEYEIYTKSAMHLLMKEYARLNQDMKNADAFSTGRLKNILEKGILPAASEILTSIPMLYPDAGMEPLYEIMERGMQDADRTSD